MILIYIYRTIKEWCRINPVVITATNLPIRTYAQMKMFVWYVFISIGIPGFCIEPKNGH